MRNVDVHWVRIWAAYRGGVSSRDIDEGDLRPVLILKVPDVLLRVFPIRG